MKILYLTRVSLNGCSAQSLQVSNFIDALNRVLDTKYIYLGKSKFLSVINALVHILANWRGYEYIYTRDSLIAILGTILLKKSYFEVHKPPSPMQIYFLRITRTNMVAISKSLMIFCIDNNLNVHSTILPCATRLKQQVYWESNNSIEKYVKDTSKLTIGHFGNLSLDRGIEFILDNWPNEFNFLHLGGSNIQTSELKKKYPDNNIFIYPSVAQSDLEEIFSNVDGLLYFIDPSWPTVPFCSPAKIADYLALNKSIIANNPGAVSELLNDKNSYIYDFLSPQSLIQALEHFKSDHAQNIAKIPKSKIFSFELRAQKLVTDILSRT